MVLAAQAAQLSFGTLGGNAGLRRPERRLRPALPRPQAVWGNLKVFGYLSLGLASARLIGEHLAFELCPIGWLGLWHEDRFLVVCSAPAVYKTGVTSPCGNLRRFFGPISDFAGIIERN